MTAIEFPLGGRVPAPGETLKLSPDVQWLRMPLPSSLEHVNLWLLDEGDAWTIVDCAIATDETRRLWEQVLSTSLDGKPVRRILATHMHSDHLGLAQWLCERCNAPLWMSAGDYRWAERMRNATAAAFGEEAAAFLMRHGVSEAAVLGQARSCPSPYPLLVPGLPPRFHAVRNGDEVRIGERSWRAIAGNGHTPEHLSFYCPALGVLVGGDMLLPAISPYVGVSVMNADANPLPDFLRSLDRFLDLPGNTLVLPSHGRPFIGIRTRVEQLHEHHRKRLETVRDSCDVPRSAAQLIPMVFRRELDSGVFRLALGEVVAHLHALEGLRAVRRTEGLDGVFRFTER